VSDSDWDLSLDLPCERTAPAQVRRALNEHTDLGWVAGDLMVVASELVNNAVEHSGATARDVIHIRVRHSAERISLVVCDPGTSGCTAHIRPGPTLFGGLGLRLVDQLTSNWGTETCESGAHCVWAEIELSKLAESTGRSYDAV
jgi:anti-sigma regulatory factor (Ser/Thr protein kinase)